MTARPIDCVEESPLPGPVEARLAWEELVRREEQREEFYEAEKARVQRLQSPVVGTYRFELTIPGESPLVLYGRTARHPGSPIWSRGLDGVSWPDVGDTTPADSYSLTLVLSRSLADLPPTAKIPRGTKSAVISSISLSEEPSTSTPDSSTWQGRLHVHFTLLPLFEDEPLGSRLESVAHEVWNVWSDKAPGRLESHFTVHSNGKASVQMRVWLRDEEIVSISGVRISDVTLR